MTRIHEIGTDLNTTAVLCAAGRHHLAELDGHLVAGSLQVVNKKQRRQGMVELQRLLRTVKRLRDMGQRITDALTSEDYPLAVTLTMECTAAGAEYGRVFALRGITAAAKVGLSWLMPSRTLIDH